MILAKPTEREEERLEELYSYDILDSLHEDDFDQITAISAAICETPIALISLIDRDRLWFKSRQGLDADEVPRDITFCAHAIQKPNEIMEVKDARKDERFHDNPLVIDDPDAIFYAGSPIVTDKGLPLGVLCVIDHKPNALTEQQTKSLEALSKQVMALLDLRRRERNLQTALQDMEAKNEALAAVARAQEEALTELSTPVAQLWEGILFMPLVGRLDAKRAQTTMQTVLHQIGEKQAKVFILDISGVPLVDSFVANHIIKIAKATRLMGCYSILSGLSPLLAQTIIELGVDIEELETTNSLKAALRKAFDISGMYLKHK